MRVYPVRGESTFSPLSVSVNPRLRTQDSTAAGILLEELQTGPKHQFLGRYLRYEAARAFRTLFVSYR
jgi:hypothetical protein